MSLLKKLLNHSKLAQYETEQKKKYKQYVKTKKTDIKLFCKSEPEIYGDVLTELRRSFRRSKRKSSSNIRKDPVNNSDVHKPSTSSNLNSNIITNQTGIIGNRTSSTTRKDSIRSRTSVKQFRAPLPVKIPPNDLGDPKPQDEKIPIANGTIIYDKEQMELSNVGTSETSEQTEVNNAEKSKSFSYTEQNDFLEHLDFELKNRHNVSTGNLEPHITIGGATSLEETTEPRPIPRRNNRSKRRYKYDEPSILVANAPNGVIENVDEFANISTFGDGFAESLQETRNEHVLFNTNLQYDQNFEIMTHDASREGMTNYLPDVQNDVASAPGSEARSRIDSFTTVASDDTFYDCEDFKESGTWNGDQYKPSLEHIEESVGQSEETEKSDQFGVHQVLSTSIEDQIRLSVDGQSRTSCSSDDAIEPMQSGTGFEELFFKFETESYEPSYKERQFFGMNYIWSEPERHKPKEIIYTTPANDTYDGQSEEYFVKNQEDLRINDTDSFTNISNSNKHPESEDEYLEQIQPSGNQLHSPIPASADASKLEDLAVMNEDIEDGWNDASKLHEPPIKSKEMDTFTFKHLKDDTSCSNFEEINDIESTNLTKSTLDVNSDASSFQNPKDVRSHLLLGNEDEITTIEPNLKFKNTNFAQNSKNNRSIFNNGEDDIENDEESKLPKPSNKTRIFRQTSLQYPKYKHDYVAGATNNDVTRRIKTNSFNHKPSRFSWEPERKYEPVFSSNLFDRYRDKFYTNEKDEDDKGQEIKDLPENPKEVAEDVEFEEDLLQSFELSVLHRVKEEVFHRLKTEECNSRVANDGEAINEAVFLDDPLKKSENTNALQQTEKDSPTAEELPKSPKKVTFKLDEPYNNRYIGNNKFPKYSNTYANEKFPQLRNDEYEGIDDEPDINAPKSLQEELILRKLKLKKVSESDTEDCSGQFEEIDLPSFKKNLKLKKSILNNEVTSEESEFEDTNMPESLFRNLNMKKSKLNKFNGTSVSHNGMTSQEYRRKFEESDAPKSLLDHINVSKARLRKHEQGYDYKDDENIPEDTISNKPTRLEKAVSFKALKFNENTQTISPNGDETEKFEYKNVEKSNNTNLKMLKVKFEESEEECDDPVERRSSVISLNGLVEDASQLKLHSRALKNEALRGESEFPDTVTKENVPSLDDYDWESRTARKLIEHHDEYNYESDFVENERRSKNQDDNEIKFLIGNENLQELSDILTSISNKDVFTQISTIEEIIMRINRKVNELDSKNNEDYPLLFHMLLQSMRIVSGLPYGLEQNLLDAQQNILSDIQNCISVMNNKKFI